MVEEQMQWTVYVHEFPNGKRYVGVTSQNPPELRWRSNGEGYNNQGYISRAIKKYGWNNVRHEILLQTSSESEAFEEEKRLISEYKTNDRNYGYNISSGGEAGAKGVVWSEERKIAYGQKYRGETHPHFGKKMSEEVKQKMRDAAKLRPPMSDNIKEKISSTLREKRGTQIVCYETGTIFSSIVEAAEWAGALSANICTAASKFPNETCKGYHWYRFGVDVSGIQIPKPMYEKRPVVCVETNQHYESISEASRSTGYDQRNICGACKEPTHTAGGQHWRYDDGSDVYEIPSSKKERKKVICLETKETFESLYEAAKAKGCRSSTISAVCRGQCKTAGGYHWRFADG